MGYARQRAARLSSPAPSPNRPFRPSPSPGQDNFIRPTRPYIDPNRPAFGKKTYDMPKQNLGGLTYKGRNIFRKLGPLTGLFVLLDLNPWKQGDGSRDWLGNGWTLQAGPCSPNEGPFYSGQFTTCGTAFVAVAAQGQIGQNGLMWFVSTISSGYTTSSGGIWTGPRYASYYKLKSQYPTNPGPAPVQTPAYDLPWIATPYPGLDPFQSPIEVPVPFPQPVPYRVSPHRQPNPDRSPEEQPGGDQPTAPRPGPAPRPRSRPSGMPGVAWNFPPVPEGTPWTPPRARPVPEVHIQRPPQRRERERKLRLTPHAAGLIGWAISAITEGLDLLDGFWKALPAKVRREAFVENGYRPLTRQQQLRVLAENWDQLERGKAAYNIAYNQVVDYIFGKLGRLGAKAQQEIYNQMDMDRPPSYQLGPADTASGYYTAEVPREEGLADLAEQWLIEHFFDPVVAEMFGD